jgi:hypothetical protein
VTTTHTHTQNLLPTSRPGAATLTRDERKALSDGRKFACQVRAQARYIGNPTRGLTPMRVLSVQMMGHGGSSRPVALLVNQQEIRVLDGATGVCLCSCCAALS